MVPAAGVRGEAHVGHCNCLHSDRPPMLWKVGNCSPLPPARSNPRDDNPSPHGGGEAGLGPGPRWSCRQNLCQGQWQNAPSPIPAQGWDLKALKAGRCCAHSQGSCLRRVAHPTSSGEGTWGVDKTRDGVSRVGISEGPRSSLLLCKGDHSS